MGARLVKFEFCPKENEQLEVSVKVPEEKRSVIHGVVKGCNNEVIKDAVVKLFEVIGSSHNCNSCHLKPLTHTFTDECGQFLFGPLCANKKYAIKVWYDDVKIRELVITPDDDHCEKCDDEDMDEYYENRKNTCKKKGYRKVEYEDYDESYENKDDGDDNSNE